MNLITKKELLASLASRWEWHYRAYLKDGDSNDKSLKYEKLLNEPNLTESRATEIIGNSSWTHNVCDECSNECDIVVQLGQESDYESSTAQICLICLQVAIQLIEVEQRNE